MFKEQQFNHQLLRLKQSVSFFFIQGIQKTLTSDLLLTGQGGGGRFGGSGRCLDTSDC